MTYKIRPKRSNVPSKVPLASDLELGELAINMADQKIYTKTPSNAIVELGGGSTIDLLAVPSDIIPDGDLTRSLGSPTHQWADLYVGNATIYLNNIPLGLDGDSQLTFNGNVIANSDGAVQVDWTNISNIPGDLSGGFDSGNITFVGDQISSTGEGVDVTSTGYAQLSSNNNYVWVDDGGLHIEVFNGDGSETFVFAWDNGQPKLQLPNNADIVDSAGNSVLGGGGGNPFDQTLNTDSEVAFSSVFLGNNITSNGMEIVTLSESGGSIDIYTDWGNGGVEVWLQHNDRVAIKTADGTYAWGFDNTGNLTLPAGGDILDSNGNSVLGGGSGVSLPADANGFLANDGTGTLSWASAPARLVSPNGDFEVTLDDTGAVVLSSYGVVKNPDHVNMVSDGWVQMQWVDTNTLENADPNATSGPTNWVYVDQLGTHIESNINRNINDSTERYDWLFDIYGKLQMPVGGDIVDSTGNSVLGGSGVTLPANASGYLTNDGAGNLAWAAGDGTFSGDYNDLVNKPTIPDAQVQSDWNEIATESPAYIWNKPTIPADISDLTDNGNLLAAGGVIPADTVAPSSPTAGQLWYDSADGRTYIYFDSSWVDAAPAGGGANTGNITFSGDNINSSNNVVNVSASNYAQLESNNAYVWVENNSATVQVNEMNWTFDNNGNLTLPDLGAETPSILYANGVSILNGLSGGGNPFNQDLNTNNSVGFLQVRTNRLVQGWNDVTKSSGYQHVDPGQTTDIWTSDNVEITSAKFTVQFETKTADPYYASFDTMTCEIVMAKKRDNGTWTDAPITVYAMVHTSEAPLATFSSYINGDGNAVLTCTPADSISARSYLKVHSVEMQSPSIQNDWC